MDDAKKVVAYVNASESSWEKELKGKFILVQGNLESMHRLFIIYMSHELSEDPLLPLVSLAKKHVASAGGRL